MTDITADGIGTPASIANPRIVLAFVNVRAAFAVEVQLIASPATQQ